MATDPMAAKKQVSTQIAEESPAKKTSWKKLPEAVRREAILKAAQQCFASKGFSDTSVNDIAHASGLTKGGIYFHFDSKDSIRAALIEDFTQGMLQQVEIIKQQTESSLEQLRQILDLLLQQMGEDNGLLLTITESVTRHGHGIAEIRDYYHELGTLVGGVIATGRQRGEFKSSGDIALMAELLLTTVSGLALHRELDRAGIDLCSRKLQIMDYLLELVVGE